jgi:hypothetical protein
MNDTMDDNGRTGNGAAHEEPRAKKVLHLKSPLVHPKTKKPNVYTLTSEEAEWQWAGDNPMMLNVFIWMDKASKLAVLRHVPITNVREIDGGPVRLSELVRPPAGLIVPAARG